MTRDDTDSGIPDPALLPTAELLDLEGCLRLRRSLYAQQADPREAVREFARLGRRLLDLGENLLAQDVVAEGLRHQPSDRELRQLAGLALARSGSPDRAHRILEELHREGHTDEETLGILARCCRDLGLRSPDPVARRRWMAEAGALYRRAFETTGGIYSGINAATLLLLLGDGQAESMARAVRDRCLTLLAEQQDSTADLYWALATLGEAHLVLQDWEQARRWYAGAARYGRGRSGSLAATRRNALLLIQHYQQDQVDLGRFLPLPRVAVFTGHMVDRPDRPTPRFPSELEPVVARALRQRLLELEVGEGYASAACGSDLLFLETLQDLGAQTHVVLPYEREAFLRESVLTSGDDTWRLRFDLALSRAGSHVTTVAPSAVPADGLAYEYANRVLHGLASLRATELSTDLVGIAVWDGQRGDLLGGTEATIRWWKKRGLRVEVVRLDRLAGRAADRPAQPRTGAPTVSPRAASLQAPTPHAMRVRAILFADVVGYSKLTDLQVQPFVEQILGLVGALLDATPRARQPEVRNTWGDGLYLVFRDVRAAGLFALELSDRMRAAVRRDLPGEMDLRIALHAGPVHAITDPITRMQTYTGSHVSRAARIEPVTPPGLVYGSQEFAALAAAEGVGEFQCDYVGRVPLAKQYGVFPMYHVRRSSG